MNTSMTINAPAAWLLALYVAVADEQGAARAALTGTTQNDIIKEYLARGTYIFPPKPALRLTTDTIAFTTAELPKWNPINLCSYHLQEAGADAVEEGAFALAAAIAVLDAAKARGAIPESEFPKAVGRISFFVNSGVKFITEICKLRAMGQLWDEICRDRYGVEDPKLRRFRYGVQVNSLGLTEQQPENNVYRILFGMLGVTLSKDARARAVQLPAWNEALGLPRPWDQQWSLRLQQIGGLRNRHAGIWRHLRRLDGHRRKGRDADGADASRDRARRGIWRRRIAGSARIYEGAAGAFQCGARRSHRDGRRNARRRQRLYRNRDLAAHRRQRPFRHRRRKGRTRSDRTAEGLARAAAIRKRSMPRSPLSNARPGKSRTSCRPRSPARKPA